MLILLKISQKKREREDVTQLRPYVSFWEVYEGELHICIRSRDPYSDLNEDLDGLPVEYLTESNEEFQERIENNKRLIQIRETENQIKELQDKLKKLKK